MFIKKVIMTQFMGQKQAEYDVDAPLVEILGENGTGKSTFATAILWVMTNRSYNLTANPMIASLFLAESSPSVTLITDIGGTEVSINKTQINTRTESEDGIKRSSNNRYSINEIPMTERDFKKKLLSYGIDMDLLLPCMHPSVFTSQKAPEMKKVLFNMATAKSDADVAKMSPETADVAQLLEQYTADEIIAKAKASKKKSDEAIKAIPERIIGLETAKTSDQEAPLLLQMKELDEKIDAENLKLKEIDARRSEQSKKMETVRTKLFETQRAISEAEQDEQLNEAHFKRKQAEHTLDIKREINDFSSRLAELHRHGKDLELEINIQSKKKAVATEEYRRYKADKAPAKLTEKDLVCPCCGQSLPENLRQEKMATYDRDLKKWKETHQKNIDRVTKDGQAACDAIREAEAKQEKLALSVANTNHELEIRKQRLADALAQETEQYKPSEESVRKLEELRTQEMRLRMELSESFDSEEAADRAEISTRIKLLRDRKTELEKRIAIIRNNDVIDGQIAELEEARAKHELAKATAEKILYQMDVLSKMKNDLLVEEINSHFSLVKFQLFEYQKNGQYKEICVPTIDGYRFGESTNTGRELRGKIDICQSLQKFYGIDVPIILDNAESINYYNLPKVSSQLFLMTVTDDKELKVVKHD